MIIKGHNIDPAVARTLEIAVEALNRNPSSGVVIAVIHRNTDTLLIRSSSGRPTDFTNVAHACLEEAVEAPCECANCQRAKLSATFALLCLAKGGHA